MDLSWIGIWLLVIAAIAIVFEGVLAGLWSVRLANRSRALAERLRSEQAQLRAGVERLRAASDEARILWLPYRRILRWVRHPLAIAILQSYARRAAAR